MLKLWAVLTVAVLATAGVAPAQDQTSWNPEPAWEQSGFFSGSVPLPEKAARLEGEADYKDAADVYNRMAKTAQDPENKARALVRKGNALLAAGKYHKAYDVYETVMAGYPLYTPYRDVLPRLRTVAEAIADGRASLLSVDNPERAAEVYELILRHAPAGEQAARDNLRLVRLYEEAGLTEEAIMAARDLLRRYPDTEMRQDARLLLARLLLDTARTGDGDGRIKREARRELEIFLDRNPDHPRADEAQLLLTWTREQLAKDILRLGEFYSREAHFRPKAARRYLHDVLREYDSTSSAPLARIMLARLEQETQEKSAERETPATDRPTEKTDDTATAQTQQEPHPSPRPERKSPEAIRKDQPPKSESAAPSGEVSKWLLPIEPLSE